jgi:hypothetical protein
MTKLRRRLAGWLLGDRDRLVEEMWPHVKTNGYDARTRARNALDAILTVPRP